MARQLIKAAKARGDTSVPGADNISHNIYRWERGAVAPAERYQLYYCGAFAIPFGQFGSSPPSTRPGLAGLPGMSANLARSGLEYLADGQNAAQLHLFGGLASARLGDAGSAHAAIAAARDAGDRDHRDELLEIGGEFGFSRATQSYYAGFILSVAASGKAASGKAASGKAGSDEAVTELDGAIGLYATGPGPGEQHSRKCQMLAHADLAIARLRAGALDAAITALEPVLALPPGERTAVEGQRLAVIRAELAAPVYRGSPAARGLDELVAGFGPGEFGSLPGQQGQSPSDRALRRH